MSDAEANCKLMADGWLRKEVPHVLQRMWSGVDAGATGLPAMRPPSGAARSAGSGFGIPGGDLLEQDQDAGHFLVCVCGVHAYFRICGTGNSELHLRAQSQLE